jgi:ribosome maturation factor RimP
MRKSVSKKTKEVIEKHIGEMNHSSSIMELTRSGARMMLQIAIEEELSQPFLIEITMKEEQPERLPKRL